VALPSACSLALYTFVNLFPDIPHLNQEASVKVRFIDNSLKENEAYIESIQKVKWNLNMENLTQDSILVVSDAKISPGKLSASEAELELRKEVAKEEKLAQPTSTKTELKKARK
jgi:hypothetical protein